MSTTLSPAELQENLFALRADVDGADRTELEDLIPIVRGMLGMCEPGVLCAQYAALLGIAEHRYAELSS